MTDSWLTGLCTAYKPLDSVHLSDKKTPMSLIDTDVSKAEEAGFASRHLRRRTAGKIKTVKRNDPLVRDARAAGISFGI